MSFTLPNLSYEYSALEPHIDARTMEIHHGKHHAAYIAKVNDAISGTAHENTDINTLISDISALPEELQGAVRNNGGGHYNHSLFWSSLKASDGNTNEPSGDLATLISEAFGSLDAFKSEFATAAATRFGSGWAWLCQGEDGSLFVSSTPNQDAPIMKGIVDKVGTPLLGLDVWEHAYYLNYQNRRPDYITAFWEVVDWDAVSKRLR